MSLVLAILTGACRRVLEWIQIILPQNVPVYNYPYHGTHIHSPTPPQLPAGCGFLGCLRSEFSRSRGLGVWGLVLWVWGLRLSSGFQVCSFWILSLGLEFVKV